MKKMNLKRKIMPCVASALMLITVLSSGMSVMAETGDGISISTMSFDKIITMDAEANVPNATYTYIVSAGEATGDIQAGVNADKVVVTGTSSNTLTFTSSDTAQTDADNNTKKYVKKSVSLDFSACNFTGAGVYRYVITEFGKNQAVTNDMNNTRIVDVYVENDGEPVVEEHVICGGCGMDFGMGPAADDAAGEHISMDFWDDCENYHVELVTIYPTTISGYTMYDGSTKSSGFTNDYDTSNVTFRKEVSGNQASYNKYFEFTVNITNAVAGTVYDVDLSNVDASPDGNTNSSQLMVGSDGTVSQIFYLKHGQEITINGIAKDSVYTITENAAGYESTAAGVKGYAGATSGTIASADIKTSYLNTKEGVIPTGIVMNVAPFAMVALIGCAGMVTFAMRRKKDEDEE